VSRAAEFIPQPATDGLQSMVDGNRKTTNIIAMSADENPYAPPHDRTAAIPEAPRSCGWELAGTAVWVGSSSQFPMVDPFTGRSEGTMMLHQITIRHRPRWLLSFPALGAVIGFASTASGSLPDQAAMVLLGTILGWILARLTGNFLPICMPRLFFEKRTIRIRKMTDRLMAGLFLLFLPGQVFFSQGPPWLQQIPSVAAVCWLFGGVVLTVMRRRLRCVRRDGARYEIRGFHPRALESLARFT
jgi:hypothetical protein